MLFLGDVIALSLAFILLNINEFNAYSSAETDPCKCSFVCLLWLVCHAPSFFYFLIRKINDNYHRNCEMFMSCVFEFLLFC